MKKNKEFIAVDLKWNNTSCWSICPITEDKFKPFIGYYPFLENSYDPISIEALSIQENSQIIKYIFELNREFNYLHDIGLNDQIPEILKLRIYNPKDK